MITLNLQLGSIFTTVAPWLLIERIFYMGSSFIWTGILFWWIFQKISLIKLDISMCRSSTRKGLTPSQQCYKGFFNKISLKYHGYVIIRMFFTYMSLKYTPIIVYVCVPVTRVLFDLPLYFIFKFRWQDSNLFFMVGIQPTPREIPVNSYSLDSKFGLSYK